MIMASEGIKGILAQLAAKKIHTEIASLEKNLGFRLSFANATSNWIKPFVRANMTGTWRSYGLKARGINYFSMGSTENGRSTRFDESSNYYQAWLGGYLVETQENKPWTPQDHYKLGLADQIKWLKCYYQCPQPFAEVDFATEKLVEDTQISGYPTQIYTGCIISNTDVGATTQSFSNKVAMQTFANMFNMERDSSQPKITDTNVTPAPYVEANIFQPYEKIPLEGYIAIVTITPKLHAVLYGNGVKEKTFAHIQNEILTTLKNVQIEKVQ